MKNKAKSSNRRTANSFDHIAKQNDAKNKRKAFYRLNGIKTNFCLNHRTYRDVLDRLFTGLEVLIRQNPSSISEAVFDCLENACGGPNAKTDYKE